MTHDDLVLQAMYYRRNVGADLGDIRSCLQFRETEPHTTHDDEAALARLVAAGQLLSVGKRWYLTPTLHKQPRGPSLAPAWQAADAWILLALCLNVGSEPCRLEHIIAIADYINHAIPTAEEMHGALNHRAAAHLITPLAERYAVTPSAREFVSRMPAACNKAVLRQLDCLWRLLQCPCCGVPLKSVRWTVALSDNSYADAVATCLRRGPGR